MAVHFRLLKFLLLSAYGEPCKITIMKVFGKAFLGGIVFAILMILLVPLFAEGMSPIETISKLTDHPLKLVSLLQIVVVSGLAFGGIFALIAWASRKNKEKTETDRLMREYLEKKLKEDLQNEK